MQEKGTGPSIDSCLTTGWIPTLAKLARLTRSVSRALSTEVCYTLCGYGVSEVLND